MERDIAKLVSFTKEYFDPIPKEDEIRICIADYDLPVKTARQELLDAILLAESVGAVKAALYHYDPSLFQVKTHDAMKYHAARDEEIGRRIDHPGVQSLDESLSLHTIHREFIPVERHRRGDQLPAVQVLLLARYSV